MMMKPRRFDGNGLVLNMLLIVEQRVVAILQTHLTHTFLLHIIGFVFATLKRAGQVFFRYEYRI